MCEHLKHTFRTIRKKCDEKSNGLLGSQQVW